MVAAVWIMHLRKLVVQGREKGARRSDDSAPKWQNGMPHRSSARRRDHALGGGGASSDPLRNPVCILVSTQRMPRDSRTQIEIPVQPITPMAV